VHASTAAIQHGGTAGILRGLTACFPDGLSSGGTATEAMVPSRLWINRLLDRRDAIAGAQHP
jgi:hypothetical protein